MLKVNLEQKLLDINNKKNVKEEKLLKQAKEILDTASKAPKMNETGDFGLLFKSSIKTSKSLIEEKTGKDYNKEKFGNNLFTHSQITSISERYHLKFLPMVKEANMRMGYGEELFQVDDYDFRRFYANKYKGTMGPETSQKIDAFKKLYNNPTSIENYYIVAPASSFTLTPEPVDPLLFYYLGGDQYVLIDKWGKDLNVTRRIWAFLGNNLAIIIGLILSLILLYAFNLDEPTNRSMFVVMAPIVVIMTLSVILRLKQNTFTKYLQNYD